MRTSVATAFRLGPVALGVAVLTASFIVPANGQTKPTGAPLVLSNTETEQPVPMAFLAPDGKTAKCLPIRLHWISKPDVGPNDDATSFTIDLVPPENPAASIFTAQLWNASLASAMAWQQPWQGARWKVLDTPATDGTGLDASLAVGMISTSARRPYPPKTVVIGSLNPDGSLGPVSHLLDRINAAAKAGMERVIIPSVQRFDTDPSGQVINIVRHATDLHLECLPVDDLITATETAMNDPLPDATLDSALPKYSNDVASYIDDFAHREQAEAANGLKFAPKESELASYPARQGAIWKSVYADYESGQDAYRAGQVYVAYRLFLRANGRMNGANALAGQTRVSFNVKTALADSDDLHDRLMALMNPPIIDKGDLQSAVVVAEMADWIYEVRASLEGAQLITKQTFSQRSDATDTEKDRAREAILFANAQCKYLLAGANFFTGLPTRLARNAPVSVDLNAEHLLPQLIPAQLATARRFTDGIRASDLRDGLLFDPRLVAYVNVLRQSKSDWDARLRKKEIEASAPAAATGTATPDAAPGDATPTKLNVNAATAQGGFDPGDTYKPPHTIVAATVAKKVSDAAQCLIWVNHDCEIATLDEKYLRLNGAMDATHEWHVKDKPKLDALLQMAEIGARRGISFGGKTEIDPSILAMIYERASYQRQQANDSVALDSLRNFWRCALLGNMCWQLAHTHKAEVVDLSAEEPAAKKDKPKKDDKKTDTAAKGDDATKKADETKDTSDDSSNAVTVVSPKGSTKMTNAVVTPAPPVNVPPTNAAPVKPEPPKVVETPPPAPTPKPAPAPAPMPAPVPAPEVTDIDESKIPVAPIATNDMVAPAPPAPAPAPVVTAQPAPPAPIPMPVAVLPSAPSIDESSIPVAPIARAQDYTGNSMPAATNAAPVGPIPPSINKAPDNADGHANSFP